MKLRVVPFTRASHVNLAMKMTMNTFWCRN